jgi:glycosyltransferase involved in cell wall biosynthesis
MRILILSNLYPPCAAGGAEILASDIAAGLERLGHEVLVLTSSHGLNHVKQDGRVWRILREFPVAHFNQSRSIAQQFTQLYNYYRRYHCPANARALRHIVSAVKPDVLYIWEITGIGVTSLLKSIGNLNIPTVFHLGSYWLLYAGSPETEQSRLRLRKLKQWLIGSFPTPLAASFIAVSATVKRKYVEAGFSPESIETIYNGIDPLFVDLPLAERPVIKERYSLLFTGRLRLEKGVFVILKALDLLLHQARGACSVHLNICGSGDKVYIDELQSFLRERNLAEVVTFHGWLPQQELVAFYDSSDIMLVPSLWQEPFGLVVAEAMARGLPVIASDMGGPAEIITHDADGILVSPGDEQALSEAIKQLLVNPQKRRQLSQAARATVEERFTIEENVRLVERHLQRAIQGNPATSH